MYNYSSSKGPVLQFTFFVEVSVRCTTIAVLFEVFLDLEAFSSMIMVFEDLNASWNFARYYQNLLYQ